jgi:adenylate cyclase
VNLSADRFEGTMEDIFDLQDRVTESVVGAIAPKLEQAEIARARHKPTESLDAYDLYLRGMASYHLLSREGTADALRLLYEAIERDPDFAMAYAMAAMCYARRKGNSWIEDRPQEVAETRRLARQAVRLGKDDAGALSVAGFALAYAGEELTDGAAVIERGLSLNPNFAAALHWSGWAKVWLSEPEAAIVHLTHAMRLSPVDPFLQMMKVAIAHAQFFAGRFEEAAAWSNAALLEHPDSHAGLRMAAASHAMAGRSAEAGKAMARLRQIDPALRVSNLRETLAPYRDQAPVTLYEDALRKAGLPE